MSRVQNFRLRDHDREQVARTREVIRFAKKLLAESDPSILWGSKPPSESL